MASDNVNLTGDSTDNPAQTQMNNLLELSSDALDLASILEGIDAQIEHFRANSIPTAEDDLIRFTRALRVARCLADALGCKASDMAEVVCG